MGHSIGLVFDSYCRYLLAVHGEAYAAQYIKRWKQDAEPPKAEAVVFAWAKASGFNPEIRDLASTGGPDFYCAPNVGSPFILEVTCIKSQTVTSQSHLSEDIGSPGGPFSLITRALNQRVKSKWKQIKASDPIPWVIAIASFHTKSSILLDRMAALNLLISDPFIRCPITPTGMGPGKPATDFKNSAFLRMGSAGNVVTKNRVISAVLLFPILETGSDPVGILHPAPDYPVNIFSLYNVPLAYVDKWPLVDDSITVRWTYESDAFSHPHREITITLSESGSAGHHGVSIR
jgi:hypothetical protein